MNMNFKANRFQTVTILLRAQSSYLSSVETPEIEVPAWDHQISVTMKATRTASIASNSIEIKSFAAHPLTFVRFWLTISVFASFFNWICQSSHVKSYSYLPTWRVAPIRSRNHDRSLDRSGYGTPRYLFHSTVCEDAPDLSMVLTEFGLFSWCFLASMEKGKLAPNSMDSWMRWSRWDPRPNQVVTAFDSFRCLRHDCWGETLPAVLAWRTSICRQTDV